MTDVTVPRPTAREIATGMVLGTGPAPAVADPGCPDWPGRAPSPLAALEKAVLPCLLRPPCLVSFSGGLDSSLVLAVAVRVARREGLPEPVPVTWRFTGAPRADESDWQDRVIRALDLDGCWEILTADDDLDMVGPVADRLLRRHGQLHPANLHTHLPIVELATGGSLLTGAGGDQVLTGWRRPPAGSVRTRLRRLAYDLRRSPELRPGAATRTFPWLWPGVAHEAYRAYRAEQRSEPRRLGDRIAWHLRRRDLRLLCAGLDTIAAPHDVVVVNPLLDSGFVASLTAWAGHRRDTSRTGLLAGISAGELPAQIVAPRRKARFLEVFFRDPTREFIRSCGNGDDSGGPLSAVDPTLVDVERLRRVWSRWPVPGGTAALVQQIRLAGSTRSAAPIPTPVRAGDGQSVEVPS